LASARNLPVRDLKPWVVGLGIPHQYVLRSEAAVIKSLAVGVTHRLSQLANESEALVEGETGELLAEVAIKADGVGVVLEDQSRAELRFPIVEDTLDADVLDTLQNAEFPLRHVREPITGLRGRRTSIRIDTNAPVDPGGGMSGGKVLPVLPLTQQLPEFVVTDATAAPWRSNPGLLDGSHPGSGRCRARDPSASQPKFIGPDQRPDDAGIVGRPGLAQKHNPLCRARIEHGTLTNGGQKNQWLDPGRRMRPACQRLLPAQNRGKTLRLPVCER
jgi:hypothetical protein